MTPIFGIAAVEPHHRGADQRRVEEEDHEVLAEIEEERDHVHPDRDPLVRVAGEAIENAQPDDGRGEGRQHHNERAQRDERKEQQLLVLAEHRGARLDQAPAA